MTAAGTKAKPAARFQTVDIGQQLRTEKRKRIADPHRQEGNHQSKRISFVKKQARLDERGFRRTNSDQEQDQQEQASGGRQPRLVRNSQQQQGNDPGEQSPSKPIDPAYCCTCGIFKRWPAKST